LFNGTLLSSSESVPESAAEAYFLATAAGSSPALGSSFGCSSSFFLTIGSLD
jgi:hypothetical protein